MIHSQVSQYFTVETDLTLIQSVHETGVGHSMLAGTGIDPGNPQRPKCSFLVFAVAIGVYEAFLNGIFSNGIYIAASAKITSGGF